MASITTPLLHDNTKLDSIRTRLDSIRTRLESIRTRLDSIRTAIDSVRTVVDRIRTGLDSIKGRMTFHLLYVQTGIAMSTFDLNELDVFHLKSVYVDSTSSAYITTPVNKLAELFLLPKHFMIGIHDIFNCNDLTIDWNVVLKN